MPENIDLGGIIERVSHAINGISGDGRPQAESQTYIATFDESGLTFSPKRFVATTNISQPMLNGDDSETQTRTVAIFEKDEQTKARFHTDSIRQGADVFYQFGSASIPRIILGNTAQGLLDEQRGIIEHFETRDDGVEVTWVLNARPPGDGSLEITAQLLGLTYAHENEQGHYFADSSGMTRVKVGHVDVVDAQGEHFDVPLIVKGDSLHVEIAPDILNKAAFPLAVDPVISADFPMTYNMHPSAQYLPAVAFNGTSYVVTWTDLRFDGSREDIYLTRIDGNGLVVIPNGLLVATSGAAPRIATNGIDFLIVWIRHSGIAWDIYGARYTGAGTLPDGNGFPISTAINNQLEPG